MNRMLVVLMVVGCGGEFEPRTCEATCQGCCTVEGTCLQGNQQDSCGSNGGYCHDCRSSGLLCSSAACIDLGGTGGGTGGGGGASGGGQASPARDGGYAFVSVSDTHSSALAYVYASAHFNRRYQPLKDVIGPCMVQVYTPEAFVGPFSSAGNIDITAGTRALQLRSPGDGGMYPAFGLLNEHVFDGGEQVHITAAGGDVPGFSASLTAPTRATLTARGITDSGVLDRAQPLTVRWSGGGPLVAISLGVNIDGGVTALDCRFPAAAGVGTVPASALQRLPPGVGLFGVTMLTSTPVTAGTWTVEVDAMDLLLNESATLR